MPELPEVETVRRGLAPVLEGRRLVRVEQRRPDLRWPIPERFVERLQGRRLDRLDRRAKYLLGYCDDGTVLILHLGMSGRLLLDRPRPAVLDRHDHILLTTDRGDVIRFNDARRFGMVDLAAADSLFAHPRLAGLGPEPLGNAFNGPALAAALAGRATPVKAALLDQRVVAGLGNIYVCEALHLARIAPDRQAARIGWRRAERLVAAIREVLGQAIAAGGSSLRDHVQPSGELGYFQHRFRVYGREGEACPTPRCAGTVARTAHAGRSTFHCPRCQR